jgi:hypothetical protein
LLPIQIKAGSQASLEAASRIVLRVNAGGDSSPLSARRLSCKRRSTQASR